MQVESCHALSELFLRDDAVSVSVEQGKGTSHVKALQIKSSCDFTKHFVQSSLSQICCFEEKAEFLDVYFSDLSGVCNPSQQPHLLHSQWQIELPYLLLEFTDRQNASFGIQWIVQVVEAIEKVHVSFLEETNDFGFEGLKALSLSAAE